MLVFLADPMTGRLEAQARTGRHSNARACVRDLIRRDRDARAARAELGEHIAAGLSSGISFTPMSKLLEAARTAAGQADGSVQDDAERTLAAPERYGGSRVKPVAPRPNSWKQTSARIIAGGG